MVAPLLLGIGACSGGDLTLPNIGGAAALQIVAGDEQQARAGTHLDDPLLVRVIDADGNPVPDARVEFRFLDPVPGATLSPELTRTDDDGEAAAMARLGSVIGTQSIVAALAGSQAPNLRVVFRAIALQEANDDDDNDDGDDDDDDKRGKGKG